MVIKHNRSMDADKEHLKNGEDDSLENRSSNKEQEVYFPPQQSSCSSTNLSISGVEMANQKRLPKHAAASGTSNKHSTNSDKSKCRRSSYTIDFKLKVIDFLEELNASPQIKNKYELVTKKFKITKSMVSKWKKQKELLIKEASKVSNKTTKTALDSAKTARTRRNLRKFAMISYPLAESSLLSEFRDRRKQGVKVNGKWFRIKMKKHIKNHYGEEGADRFKASKNWLRRFCARNGVSLRRPTNKKKIGNPDRLPIIQKLHCHLREDIRSRKRHGTGETYHPKWGRWMPCKRFNVDHVPCPFVIDNNKTYEEEGTKNVWISQPNDGLDKRQCTLQLCISPEEVQRIPPAVIFRGKGKVKSAEKTQYDKRVHVYFQEKGWMDGKVALEWVEMTYAPFVDKKSENVLFLDNLSSQMTGQFHRACRSMANTVVYPLPPQETDKCQPVDQGEGNLIKVLMGEQMDLFLQEDDNLEKWQSKITASERRILITKWLGEAWEKLGKEYPDFRRKLFLKTGLLMTADKTDDDLIRPEGFEDYHFY
eukprot:Seg7753.1 transcript_id=Seg7753.1/GoldUCD/mRNA.D3Y31 product="hypothetical protein" protein_id=Seg7753.1/GoldUCD/D3Y31